MTTPKQERTDLSKAEKEAYALVGRVGGKANFKKHGKKHMTEIAKKGATARWGDKKPKK